MKNKISKEVIDEWLSVGSYAPSGDNIQAWIVTTPDDGSIVLQMDPGFQHVLDKTKNATLLSLGCFFECLNQSAEHFGIKIESSILKDKILTLTIAPQSKKDLEIVIEKIKMRVTDRGNYHQMNDLSLLNSVISVESDITYIQNLPANIISIWADFEYCVWKNTFLMADVLKWIKMTRNKNTKMGISVHSLGIGFGRILALYFLKLVHALAIPLKWFTFKPMFAERIKDVNMNSSGYIIFWESKLDEADVVNLGRKIQRVWMELNFHEISAQPMAIQSLLISELSCFPDSLKSSFPEKCFTLANETLQSMQILKDNPAASLPAFILRIGKTQKKVEPHGRNPVKRAL